MRQSIIALMGALLVLVQGAFAQTSTSQDNFLSFFKELNRSNGVEQQAPADYSPMPKARLLRFEQPVDQAAELFNHFR